MKIIFKPTYKKFRDGIAGLILGVAYLMLIFSFMCSILFCIDYMTSNGFMTPKLLESIFFWFRLAGTLTGLMVIYVIADLFADLEKKRQNVRQP